MNAMIVYKTDMVIMPSNCKLCPLLSSCPHGLAAGMRIAERPEQCPLLEVKEKQAPPKTTVRIDYGEIQLQFNTTCRDLPKVNKLSDARKRRIKAAHADLGGDYQTLFDKVQASDFLTGRNGKWVGCNFDWIFKPENLTKILEGTYDNNRGKSAISDVHEPEKRPPSYDIKEFESLSMFND